MPAPSVNTYKAGVNVIVAPTFSLQGKQRSDEMKAKSFVISTATAIALGSSPVIADHNSKNGDGWANMPNDIHNTRMETREADDNDAFKDFVKYGEGSESVNSLDSDDTTAKRNKAQEGNANAEQAQTAKMQGAQNSTREKKQNRARTDRAASSSARERTATQREHAPRADRESGNRGRSAGRRN